MPWTDKSIFKCLRYMDCDTIVVETYGTWVLQKRLKHWNRHSQHSFGIVEVSAQEQLDVVCSVFALVSAKIELPPKTWFPVVNKVFALRFESFSQVRQSVDFRKCGKLSESKLLTFLLKRNSFMLVFIVRHKVCFVCIGKMACNRVCKWSHNHNAIFECETWLESIRVGQFVIQFACKHKAIS